MNKTKKNVFLKVAGLMAAIMMLTTCIVAGTMAKYTSTGNQGIADLTPAEWHITANGNEFTTPLTNLTWNIYDEGTTSPVADASVTTGKIAPGTWGYATIAIKNEGEVAATLKVSEFTAPTVGSTGLVFKCVTMTETPKSYTEVSSADDLKTTEYALAKEGTVNIYVCYQWQFDASQDEEDTEMGTDPTPITFGQLSITATQAEPEAD